MRSLIFLKKRNTTALAHTYQYEEARHLDFLNVHPGNVGEFLDLKPITKPPLKIKGIIQNQA
jgi:hypothetical protein